MEPITEEVAATAMCLWEAYLEDVNRDKALKLRNLHKLKKMVGTAALRKYLLDVASAVETEYSGNFGFFDAFECHSWDWDVLPLFLQKFDASVVPIGHYAVVDSPTVYWALRDTNRQLKRLQSE